MAGTRAASRRPSVHGGATAYVAVATSGLEKVDRLGALGVDAASRTHARTSSSSSSPPSDRAHRSVALGRGSARRVPEQPAPVVSRPRFFRARSVTRQAVRMFACDTLAGAARAQEPRQPRPAVTRITSATDSLGRPSHTSCAVTANAVGLTGAVPNVTLSCRASLDPSTLPTAKPRELVQRRTATRSSCAQCSFAHDQRNTFTMFGFNGQYPGR